MTPKVLCAHIRPLPEYLPHTKALEAATGVGVGYDGAWYRSQKEHWIGWVSEYEGAGEYGRSETAKRNAKNIYNRIQCAPMLFWLAEALDLPAAKLDVAFKAVTEQEAKGAKQCAALRRVIAWRDIDTALSGRSSSRLDRIRIAFANWRG